MQLRPVGRESNKSKTPFHLVALVAAADIQHYALFVAWQAEAATTAHVASTECELVS
jgi:hypothetical protein